MKLPGRSNMKQVALFALIGPPVAALFWQTWVAVTAEFPPHHSVGSWLSTWAGLTMFAYLWGLAPAFLTGVAAVFLQSAMPGHSTSARTLRIAGTVALGAVLSWALPQVFPGGDSDLTLGALGAAAALVLACWAEWRVRPNNSSKPTPLRGAA